MSGKWESAKADQIYKSWVKHLSVSHKSLANIKVDIEGLDDSDDDGGDGGDGDATYLVS